MLTEPPTATFYIAYLIKKLWGLVAFSLVMVAVLLSLLRYSLPYMNEQKQHLESWLSNQIGAELRIGEISAQWSGIGPSIVLSDLQLIQNQQSPISLDIVETAIEVDFWESVLAWQIRAKKFDLRGMQLTLDLESLNQGNNDYPIIEALEKLFLQQLQLFSISDSKIVLTTQSDQQVILVDQVTWVNKDEHHQGTGQFQNEEITSNSASFILDLYGNQRDLYGTFFAKGEELDLSPWVAQWISSEPNLVESRGSFVMWATINNSTLQSIQLDLSNSRFNWDTAQSDIRAEILGGQIIAKPINDEWVFNLDNLRMQINDQVLVSNWLGKIDPQRKLLLQQDKALELGPLLPLLPLFISKEQAQLLKTLQPQSQLNSLSLQHSLQQGLLINGSLSDLQWQQTQSIPGMAKLDLEFNWFTDQGSLKLKSKASQLTIDKQLSENLPYERFYADIYVQQTDQDFTFTTERMLFKSELLSLHPQLSYRTLDHQLAFSAQVDAIEVPLLEYLYPGQLIGQNTRDYLIGALQQGVVTGAQLLWHGPVSAFPFKDNQGIFQAQVQIEQGTLKFSPEWPALTDFALDLQFENQGLSMHSHQGRLLDVVLEELSAQIPLLSAQAVLTIDAKAQAQGQEVTALMLQSSLAPTLGKTLEQIRISGPVGASLNLHIPLQGQGWVAKGHASLNNNLIDIESLDINLQDTKGDIHFVNDQISIQGLTAKLLDQPINLGLMGSQQEDGYGTNIKLQGDWSIMPLLATYHPNLQKYLSGQSDWQAEIHIKTPTEGYLYSAKITSDLTGLGSELPAPFAKQKDQSMPVIFSAQGNQNTSSIKITLGDQVQFNGNLPHQDKQFSRAHLAIGSSDLVGMGLGFSISANISELDTTPWYDAISSLITNLPKTSKPLLEAPKRIFINADTAIIASQKFNNLEMVAKNTSDSWLVDIYAKQAKMEVVLYKDWLNKGVNINADFIQLAKWQTPADNQQSLSFTPDINALPPVQFSCERCRYLNHDLGKIDLSLSRAPTGMRIEDLRLNNDHGLFFGSGDWFLTEGKSSTRLQGQYSSSDFGAFLKGFDIDSGIKDSQAMASFDLSWQRAPYEFNFDSLNGDIDWRLSDGYLTEVTDKGSRIFSLLSLESLVRKLKLDFRDVFAKGFFYDKMHGSFQVEKGIADTQDTIVDGAAGEITMQGSTDLNAQQLNYKIDFTPNLTSSLPVIMAWMVSPATALAALALDQVLTSAKVISNIKFALTGTLEAPVLTELGRDSKEVSLPASVTPQATPKALGIDSKLIKPISLQLPAETPVNG